MLVVANIPEDQNTLPALNSHFRQFGEVLKITVHPEEGKASVQLADRAAAEAAANEPVMGNRDITLAWAQRPGSKGKGESKGCGKGAKGSPGPMDKVAENRVLLGNPEEQQKLDESRKRREEVTKRKAALISSVTDQMKGIMVKMQAPGLPEAKKAAYKDLLHKLKGKMDSLSSLGEEPQAQAWPSSSSSQPSKSAASKGSGKSGGKWVLDNRRKVLRVNLPQGWTLERLKETLKRFSASIPDEQVQWEAKSPAIDAATGQLLNTERVILRFKDPAVAEQLMSQRNDLPFFAEWHSAHPPSPGASPAHKPSPPPLQLDSPLGVHADESATPQPDSGDLQIPPAEPSSDVAATGDADAAPSTPPAKEPRAATPEDPPEMPTLGAETQLPAAEAEDEELPNFE